MKKEISYVVMGLVISMAMACGSTKSATTSTPVKPKTPVVNTTSETKTIKPAQPIGIESKIKIVFAEAATKTIPDDLTSLVMPLTEGCASTSFINFNSKSKNSPELLRLATPEAKTNLAIDINGGLSKSLTIDEFTQRYQRTLQEQKLDYSFVKPAAEGLDVKKSLDNALTTSKTEGQLVYIYTTTSQLTSYKGVNVYNNVNALRSAIAKELCENKTGKEVVVYFEVPDRIINDNMAAKTKVDMPVVDTKSAVDSMPKNGVKQNLTKPKGCPANYVWNAAKKTWEDPITKKAFVVAPAVAVKDPNKKDDGLEGETSSRNVIEVKDIKK